MLKSDHWTRIISQRRTRPMSDEHPVTGTRHYLPLRGYRLQATADWGYRHYPLQREASTLSPMTSCRTLRVAHLTMVKKDKWNVLDHGEEMSGSHRQRLRLTPYHASLRSYRQSAECVTTFAQSPLWTLGVDCTAFNLLSVSRQCPRNG